MDINWTYRRRSEDILDFSVLVKNLISISHFFLKLQHILFPRDLSKNKESEKKNGVKNTKYEVGYLWVASNWKKKYYENSFWSHF